METESGPRFKIRLTTPSTSRSVTRILDNS